MSLVINYFRGKTKQQRSINLPLGPDYSCEIALAINPDADTFKKYLFVQLPPHRHWQEDKLYLAAPPDVEILSTPESAQASSPESDALYLWEQYVTYNNVRYGILGQLLRATKAVNIGRPHGTYLRPAQTSCHLHPIDDPDCPGLVETFYNVIGDCMLRTTGPWTKLNRPVSVAAGTPHQLRCDDKKGALNVLFVPNIPQQHRIRTVTHKPIRPHLALETK